MKNSERDEERRSHINGIVQMRHEHDGAEKDGGDDKNISQGAPLPENKGHEERQAGMAGKEKVIAEGESFEKGRRGAVVDASRYWSEVCQSDETGTDDDEKGGSLENKGNNFRIFNAERADEKPQQHWSIDREAVHIEDRNIVENEVAHRIAGSSGGIVCGIKIDDQTNTE